MVWSRTINSDSFFTRQIAARPWIPLCEPRWQSAHRGKEVNHKPCSISWASLGVLYPPPVPHTPHGKVFTRSTCLRCARVWEGLFLEITSGFDG